MTAKKAMITVIAIVALGFGLYWFYGYRDKQGTNEPEHINGRITNLSEGCSSGGTCSLTVDNAKTIITGCGVLPNDPRCLNYDKSKLRLGGQIESIAIKAERADYYNLDCDICTIKIE